MSTEKHTYEDFLPLREDLIVFASGLLKSREDAEDAVQNLYLKLWERKDRLKDIEAPKAYCMAILKNACLDTLDSARMRNSAEMPDDMEDTLSLEARLDFKEKLEETMQQIDRLPAGQRTIVILRAVQDQSYEQISRSTGMSGQTMRTQLSVARKTLRSRLAWATGITSIIAAVLLIGIGKEPKDTFDDPALAYAELERTMAYISTKMQSGADIARKAEPAMDKVENILNNVNNKEK